MQIMMFLYFYILQVDHSGGIQQDRGRERQREKDLGREGEMCNGERERCGLILTASLNQQHL
jgi:hypothetical protein